MNTETTETMTGEVMKRVIVNQDLKVSRDQNENLKDWQKTARRKRKYRLVVYDSILPVFKIQRSGSKKIRIKNSILSPSPVSFSPSNSDNDMSVRFHRSILQASLFPPMISRDFFFFFFALRYSTLILYAINSNFSSDYPLLQLTVQLRNNTFEHQKGFYAVLDSPDVSHFSVQVVLLFSKQLHFARCMFSLFLLNFLSLQSLDPLRCVVAFLCQLPWGLDLVAGVS